MKAIDVLLVLCKIWSYEPTFRANQKNGFAEANKTVL